MIHHPFPGTPYYVVCYECGWDSREDLLEWEAYGKAVDAADRHVYVPAVLT